MSCSRGGAVIVVRPMCGVCGVDDGEVHMEEEESGARQTRKMLSPTMPKTEEVEEHDKTHLPYRNWCRHCVRGRGREMSHQACHDEPSMTELHIDFEFLGEEDDPGKAVPVLVAGERASRMTLAAAVPRKSTGTYIARRLVAFMREIGCELGDMIVKSDQEPAIMAIVTEVGRVRAASGSGRYVVENSPVGSSSSNGVIERAVLSVEQQVRVEERSRGKMGSSHPSSTFVYAVDDLVCGLFC